MLSSYVRNNELVGYRRREPSSLIDKMIIYGSKPSRTLYKVFGSLLFEQEDDKIVWKPFAGGLLLGFTGNLIGPDELRAHKPLDELFTTLGFLVGSLIPAKILSGGARLGLRGLSYGFGKVGVKSLSPVATRYLGDILGTSSLFALNEFNGQIREKMLQEGKPFKEVLEDLDYSRIVKEGLVGAAVSGGHIGLLKLANKSSFYRALAYEAVKNPNISQRLIASGEKQAIDSAIATAPLGILTAIQNPKEDFLNSFATLYGASLILGAGMGSLKGAGDVLMRVRIDDGLRYLAAKSSPKVASKLSYVARKMDLTTRSIRNANKARIEGDLRVVNALTNRISNYLEASGIPTDHISDVVNLNASLLQDSFVKFQDVMKMIKYPEGHPKRKLIDIKVAKDILESRRADGLIDDVAYKELNNIYEMKLKELTPKELKELEGLDPYIKDENDFAETVLEWVESRRMVKTKEYVNKRLSSLMKAGISKEEAMDMIADEISAVNVDPNDNLLSIPKEELRQAAKVVYRNLENLMPLIKGVEEVGQRAFKELMSFRTVKQVDYNSLISGLKEEGIKVAEQIMPSAWKDSGIENWLKTNTASMIDRYLSTGKVPKSLGKVLDLFEKRFNVTYDLTNIEQIKALKDEIVSNWDRFGYVNDEEKFQLMDDILHTVGIKPFLKVEKTLPEEKKQFNKKVNDYIKEKIKASGVKDAEERRRMRKELRPEAKAKVWESMTEEVREAYRTAKARQKRRTSVETFLVASRIVDMLKGSSAELASLAKGVNSLVDLTSTIKNLPKNLKDIKNKLLDAASSNDKTGVQSAIESLRTSLSELRYEDLINLSRFDVSEFKRLLTEFPDRFTANDFEDMLSRLKELGETLPAISYKTAVDTLLREVKSRELDILLTKLETASKESLRKILEDTVGIESKANTEYMLSEIREQVQRLLSLFKKGGVLEGKSLLKDRLAGILEGDYSPINVSDYLTPEDIDELPSEVLDIIDNITDFCNTIHSNIKTSQLQDVGGKKIITTSIGGDIKLDISLSKKPRIRVNANKLITGKRLSEEHIKNILDLSEEQEMLFSRMRELFDTTVEWGRQLKESERKVLGKTLYEYYTVRGNSEKLEKFFDRLELPQKASIDELKRIFDKYVEYHFSLNRLSKYISERYKYDVLQTISDYVSAGGYKNKVIDGLLSSDYIRDKIPEDLKNDYDKVLAETDVKEKVKGFANLLKGLAGRNPEIRNMFEKFNLSPEATEFIKSSINAAALWKSNIEKVLKEIAKVKVPDFRAIAEKVDNIENLIKSIEDVGISGKVSDISVALDSLDEYFKNLSDFVDVSLDKFIQSVSKTDFSKSVEDLNRLSSLLMSPTTGVSISNRFADVIDFMGTFVSENLKNWKNNRKLITKILDDVIYRTIKESSIYTPRVYEKYEDLELNEQQRKELETRFGRMVTRIGEVKYLIERKNLPLEVQHQLRVSYDPAYRWGSYLNEFYKYKVSSDILAYYHNKEPKSFSSTQTDVHTVQIPEERTKQGIYKYGALAGMWTTPEMYKDLNEVVNFVQVPEYWLYKKVKDITYFWMMMRTVGSVFTGIRNFLFIPEKMFLDEIPMIETSIKTREEIKRLQANREEREKLIASGLITGEVFADVGESSFIMNQLGSKEHPLSKSMNLANHLISGVVPEGTLKKLMFWVGNVAQYPSYQTFSQLVRPWIKVSAGDKFSFSKVTAAAAKAYGAMDDIGRLHYYVYEKGRIEKLNKELNLGLSEEQIKKEAINFARLNYPHSADVPDFVKRLNIVKPFFGWYWSSAGAVMRSLLFRPMRWMGLLGIAHLLESAAYTQWGEDLVSDERERQLSLGDFMRDMLLLRIPMAYNERTNSWEMSSGETNAKVYLNLTWMIPYMDLYSEDVITAVGNPVAYTVEALAKKKDPITGADVYYEYDPPNVKAAKIISYLVRNWSWNITPGSAEVLNWYDKTYGLGSIRESPYMQFLMNFRSAPLMRRMLATLFPTEEKVKPPASLKLLQVFTGVQPVIQTEEEIGENVRSYQRYLSMQENLAIGRLRRRKDLSEETRSFLQEAIKEYYAKKKLGIED